VIDDKPLGTLKPQADDLAAAMPRRTFTAFLEPAEEGGYVVKCVELPVATQGETRREALRNMREAIEGYLEVRAEMLGRAARARETVEIAVRQAAPSLVA
jgi:predicted RNase H-like HicB family nuclease